MIMIVSLIIHILNMSSFGMLFPLAVASQNWRLTRAGMVRGSPGHLMASPAQTLGVCFAFACSMNIRVFVKVLQLLVVFRWSRLTE